MAIETSCVCGARFKVKSQLAGKRVKCPKCGSAFVVPQEKVPDQVPTPNAVVSNDQSVIIQCVCGSRFQAQSHLSGKTVACPKCGHQLSIPPVPQSQAEPLLSPISSNDPFATPSNLSPINQSPNPLAGGLPMPGPGNLPMGTPGV